MSEIDVSNVDCRYAELTTRRKLIKSQFHGEMVGVDKVVHWWNSAGFGPQVTERTLRRDLSVIAKKVRSGIWLIPWKTVEGGGVMKGLFKCPNCGKEKLFERRDHIELAEFDPINVFSNSSLNKIDPEVPRCSCGKLCGLAYKMIRVSTSSSIVEKVRKGSDIPKIYNTSPAPKVVQESLKKLKKILEGKVKRAQEAIDWINKHIEQEVLNV